MMKSSQKMKPKLQTKSRSEAVFAWCLWCGKKFKHDVVLNTHRCPWCNAGWYTMEKTGQFFYWSDRCCESRLAQPVPLGLLMVANEEELSITPA